ncbi:MAG: UbiA family prenyltransferase [Elusimicrobiales bacterium]
MIRRWISFLRERCLFFTAFVLWGCALDALVQRAHGLSPKYSMATVMVVVCAQLMGAAIRARDEIKDFESDKRFYPDRPLVSGRISERELALLERVLIGAMLALNLLWPLAPAYMAVVAAYLVLMAKWFFMPGLISGNRLLALATHSPVNLLFNIYAMAFLARYHGLGAWGGKELFIASWMMMPVYAIEFARKTFAPRQEREGLDSYSSIMGPRAAAAAALALGIGHCALLAIFAGWLGIPAYAAIGAALFAAGFAAACARFLLRPETGNLNMTVWSVRYRLAVCGLLALSGLA